MARPKLVEQGVLMDTEIPETKKLKALGRKFYKFLVETYKPACEKRKDLLDKIRQEMQAAGQKLFKSGDVTIEVREHEDTVKVKVGSDAADDDVEEGAE